MKLSNFRFTLAASVTPLIVYAMLRIMPQPPLKPGEFISSEGIIQVIVAAMFAFVASTAFTVFAIRAKERLWTVAIVCGAIYLGIITYSVA